MSLFNAKVKQLNNVTVNNNNNNQFMTVSPQVPW